MEKIYGQIDLETIEKLADIINRKELSELTISNGEKSITLKGKKFIPPMPVPAAPAFRFARAACSRWRAVRSAAMSPPC